MYTTHFCLITTVDFILKGQVGQVKVVNSLRNCDFLVISEKENVRRRLCLNDKKVNRARDDIGDESDLRQCGSCDLDIGYKNWPTHVRSYEHQIQFKIRKIMLSLCWYGMPNIDVHNPATCRTCLNRLRYSQKKKIPAGGYFLISFQ